MTRPKRHLHRDYNTAFCGRDASHILMTYALEETDCARCREAAGEAQAKAEAEAERTRAEAEEAEARHREELAAHHEAAAAAEAEIASGEAGE